MPVLVPPPPPPRQIASFADELVPTIAPSPIDTALVSPPSPTPARPPAKIEPAKPEPPPLPPDRPVTASPALTLKPAPGVVAQTEASIRALVDRAARDLQRVKYAGLNADARAQFEIARGFIQQSEEALKQGNLLYAGLLADKAATMASVLVR